MAILAALLGSGYAMLAHLGTSRLRVERERLTISTVRQGVFQELLIPSGEVLGDGSLSVRAAIDPSLLPRIGVGQTGRLELGGATHQLEISAIHPAAGRVEIDLRFTGKPPQGLEPGQILHVRLPLGARSPANLLKRGAFFQRTGGHWVYVVDEESGTAVKRPVRLGRQNPEVHEVLSGLAPGEKVITSSYDRFGDSEELVLQ